MSNDDVIATSPDGNYRVRIEPDTSADMPYNDGGSPVLRIETGRWDGALVEEVTEIASYRLPEEILAAAERFLADFGRRRALKVFARYLRIFHGSTSFVTRGPDQNTDYTYVSFDTAEWREEVGATPVEGHELASLDELNAWLDDDVYGVIVEERVRTVTRVYRSDRDAPFEEIEDRGWVEVDSAWGHYGREWAEQAAREALGLWTKATAEPSAA